MRFADGVVVRRVRGATGALALLLAMGTLGSCADGFSPLSGSSAPDSVSVTAVRMNAVRVSWKESSAENVVTYVVERRTDLAGPFVTVAQVSQSGLARGVWIDTDVTPETFYGYRVIAVTTFGDRSAPSAVGGTRTPPRPGIEIATLSNVTVADALDPDGYSITIAGPDTVRAPMGVAAKRRFSPLRPGRYTVTLGGLVERCRVSGEPSRTVEVTDTTATTIAAIEFSVACRDPNRGDITVQAAITGASPDEEVTVDVLGQAADTTLPTRERVFSAQRTVARNNPSVAFANLRPGSYDVTVRGIASNCALTGGPATRAVSVTPLGTANITFAIACTGAGGGPTPPSGPGAGTAPFVWRNRWSTRSPAVGSTVVLESVLDVSSRSTQRVSGVQADLSYDPAVLRYDSDSVGQLPSLTVNGGVPGVVSFLAASPGAPRSGVVTLARFKFTVIGAAGARSRSATANLKAGSPTPFQDSVRVEEDSLTVVAAGTPPAPTPPAPTPPAPTPPGPTPPANVLPVARPGGPYTGVAGTPITVNGSASSDSDGSIASYAWSFGDGTTATGVSPTKTYTAAGSYTITLTVTDNRGGTASATTTATITAAPAPGPTPPPTPPTDGAPAWVARFGALDPGSGLVTLTITFDLRGDLAETPGPEALQSFVVDSLRWDPAVLQFVSINLGPGVTGSSNQSAVSTGRIAIAGSLAAGQQSGLLTLATVRFRAVGTASGSTTTTRTTLGPLQGAASTGFYTYNARSTITEGTFTRP